jgi:hypothetical protein
MAVPFISSFCTHSRDQAYEQENGLLSQWRGYGQDGGCCLVFDTGRLVELLLRESGTFYWVAFGIDDVTYATPDVVVADRYPALVREFAGIIEGGVLQSRTWAPATSNAIARFIEAATGFKHQGFKEEREVRIVSVPGSAETAQATSREHPEFTLQPLKAVHACERENRGRPYIRLFDSLGSNLPIKRIIIGPSRKQDENLKRAFVAAGRGIKLTRSHTPYLE